jgi:hippurate hydrolase
MGSLCHFRGCDPRSRTGFEKGSGALRVPWAALTACMLAAGAAAAEGPKDPPAADLKERIADINKRVADQYTSLEALYKHLHSHPELSLQEEQTAVRLAREIKPLGFDVTAGVGGHGIVAVLKNGEGPTVLVRTDMDALPVVEQTGLPYASTVRAHDRDGNDVGVMHTCGHDMHMT